MNALPTYYIQLIFYQTINFIIKISESKLKSQVLQNVTTEIIDKTTLH